LVIGVTHSGDARAYPIRYLSYHHQVQDRIGGKAMIITYCNVCRSARVFEPIVRGKPEEFRLVGMDHFNAMFEDASTRSWWRQATGEAVVGKLKGEHLPEVLCQQMTLNQWFEIYPNSLVMQPDPESWTKYDTLGLFDVGKGRSHLTRTDTVSWHEKSWVVGLEIRGHSKAYNWNRLLSERVIHDEISGQPIVIAVADDNKSFAAFERLPGQRYTIRGDTLSLDTIGFSLSGEVIRGSHHRLKLLKAYQEFWHSWQTFHPGTERY
jgi:hypothetical protein